MTTSRESKGEMFSYKKKNVYDHVEQAITVMHILLNLFLSLNFSYDQYGWL